MPFQSQRELNTCSLFLSVSLWTLHLFHSHFWNKRHCDGSVHTLPHFSMLQHEQTCSNRWGMAVKDKSPESFSDLLPGDHLQIKVTVFYLWSQSVYHFDVEGSLKPRKAVLYQSSGAMSFCFRISEMVKWFPKEQTLKHICITVPKVD